MVKTVVKSKHLLAFKLWFLNMNYVVNDLADGGFTAKIKAKEFKKQHRYVLVSGETGALYHIASESHHLHSDFVRKLEATLRQRVNNGTGVILEVNSNADLYYHVLSSYIAEHEQTTNNIDKLIQGGGFDKAFKGVFGLPIGVVDSLGEVS